MRTVFCVYQFALADHGLRASETKKGATKGDAWALTTDLWTATTSAIIVPSFRVVVGGMWAGITFLACVVLGANATAAPAQYAVDGLAVGTKLNFDSASYRDYRCSPSNQFDGLTWCQKTPTDRKRRASQSAAYSILHSRERDVLYVNRSQELSSFNRTEAENEIQRHSRNISESPRMLKMPHRSGLPDALIAVWGGITLEQLDQASIKLLAAGKGPKKGLLIDFLGDFVRSAKQGLPIYRIDGGPGLIFGASFGQKGGGTLRLAAVDAFGFHSPPREEQPTAQVTADKAEAEPNQPAAQVTADKPEAEPNQPTAQVTADKAEAEPNQPAAQVTADKAEAATNQPELGQTIEKLKTEIARATAKIAELEKATATAEAARIGAAKASVDAETAKREIEQISVTAKANLEATIAELEVDEAAAADAGTSRWENALPGAIGGLFVVLAASTVGFLVDRRKTSVPQQPIWNGTTPIDVSAQYQIDVSAQYQEAEIVRYAVSSEMATAKAAFERELEQQVAAINATQDKLPVKTDRSNHRSAPYIQ